MYVQINDLDCVLTDNTSKKDTRSSTIWLEMVCGLTKDHNIQISFTEKANERELNFIFIENEIKAYCIINPNFGTLSISQLIGEKLNGFHILEATEELENQILNK